MINSLQKIIAKYVNENVDTSKWKSVRESYGYYTYIAFLCICTKTIDKADSINDVFRIARSKEIEDRDVISVLENDETACMLAREVLDLISHWEECDVERLYQEYLCVDFTVQNNVFSFEKGKNNRDILGSYYTQEEFAEIITRKAIDDYAECNDINERISVVDYSCGGSAFLRAAKKICEEMKLSLDIYGYDVDPVAVIVSRTKLVTANNPNSARVKIMLGNPLLPNCCNSVDRFEKAISGRYYNLNMGVKPITGVDIVLGNPPWEKIRFEEKKFLKHFLGDADLATKNDRKKKLDGVAEENLSYYETLLKDYDDCKKYLKTSDSYKNSNCGEINTYALFTELSFNMLKPMGIGSLIVKSSLVKLPVYKKFFKELAKGGELYELFMFSNRKKIFSIDSREEFSVIYLTKGNNRTISVALGLDDYHQMINCNKVKLSYDELCIINPETGMLPSVKNDQELVFLIDLSKRFSTFGEIYKECHYGRLVHLTNHSKDIRKKRDDDVLPIYEGKFIEIYTGKYATFKDMTEKEKYKNKASAREIDNPQGNEYPEARFYIRKEAWEKMSRGFDKTYVVAWRSLTSATNRRTMISTILPLIPTCQSIQLLQLNDIRQLLHIVALFNSIVFDYIVRLKMVGLDLTQTIIKQLPVPQINQYEEVFLFKGIETTMSEHIISRLRFLYIDDERIKKIFEEYNCYDINKDRKEVISEIDCLVGHLYGLSKTALADIANSFDAFYSKKEVTAYFL